MGRGADLDWNDLRAFLAAARAGTLAGAARALGVEHSTVGRRLSALEESLGAALVTRAPAGLALTAAGARLVPLVEAMERAAVQVGEAVGGVQQRVRLATPSTFARHLAARLADFHAAHPDITIELISGSARVDLRRGEADIALRMGAAGDDEDLMVRPLGEMAWSLYAAPAYLAGRPAPADPRALTGHDLIGFDGRLGGVPGARWLTEHGAGATVIMRCREMSDVVAACVASLGLAVIPCMAAAAEPSLRRLTPEVLGGHRLLLVYRKEVLVSPAVTAVIELLAASFSPSDLRGE